MHPNSRYSSSSGSPLFTQLIDPILPLNGLCSLLPLRQILRTLHHFLRLVIQHHEVSIHEVESVQFITRLLGIGDFVIHDEGGALGGWGVTLSDLADGTEFAEEAEEGGRIEVVGEVFDEENSVDVDISEEGEVEEGCLPVCFWGELVRTRHFDGG